MATVFKQTRKCPKTGQSKKGKKWIARYKDESGKWKDKTTGVTCKQTAQQIANQLENEAQKRRNGLIDIRGENLKKSFSEPISGHIEAFRAKLTAEGASASYIATTVNQLHEFVKYCRIDNLKQVSVDNVNSFSSYQQDLGKSNRTVQSKVRAIKMFCKWMFDSGKIPDNPIAKIKTPSPEKDRRHRRRMMTKQEWDFLADKSQGFAKRWNMAGFERRLLYWTAIETGFRSNELRELRPANLNKNSHGHHYILLKGQFTKNNKDAIQYITPALAVALKDHLKTIESHAPIFQMPSAANIVRMFRDDLQEARELWIADPISKERKKKAKSDFLKYKNSEGHVLDFHALRHTCGAWLVIAGINVRTVQAIMRHSTPTLTLGTYGHLLEGAEYMAIQAVSEQFSPFTSSKKQKAA